MLGREGEGASAVIASGVMKCKVRKMISKAGCCRASAGRIPIESCADACGAAAESHLCSPFPAAASAEMEAQEPAAETRSFYVTRNFGRQRHKMRKGDVVRSEKPQQGPLVGQTPGTSVPWGFLQPHHRAGHKTLG